MFDDHHHGEDRTAIWIPAPEGVAAGLVSGDEVGFFIPPYVGVKGWVGVRIDLQETDWDEVAGLIGQAWGMVSSKK